MLKLPSKVAYLLFLSVALFLLFEGLASASEIQLLSPKVSDSQGTVEARVTMVPSEDIEFHVGEPDSNQRVSARATPLPVNLWILVDSAAICQTQKVDTTINQLVHALKRQAHSETLLTVVTYTSEASDFIVRRKPVEEATDFKLDCENRPFSSSYDRHLARLLQEDRSETLPIVAWIFTGGNIDLARGTASLLNARNAEINLVLYNEFIEKEIRPALQSTAALLHGQAFNFNILPKAESGVYFPSLRYQLQFGVRRQWQGRSPLLQFSARTLSANANTYFAKNTLSMSIPLTQTTWFWNKYGRWILLCTLLAALVYLGYRIVRYYQPRCCSRCKRRLSVESPVCLFCEAAVGGVLIGDFRRRIDGFGAPVHGRRKVVPLRQMTELGTHRRSPILFPRARKRTCFARLVREHVSPGRFGFQLLREPNGTIDIRVNGKTVKQKRYLAPGDELVIDTTKMTFLCDGGQQ